MPRTRLVASRTKAKASGRISLRILVSLRSSFSDLTEVDCFLVLSVDSAFVSDFLAEAFSLARAILASAFLLRVSRRSFRTLVWALSSPSDMASYFGSRPLITLTILRIRARLRLAGSPKTPCKIRVVVVLSASLSVGLRSFLTFGALILASWIFSIFSWDINSRNLQIGIIL